MDLSLIYIFYTVHNYMYFEGLIYSESKKSLLYIAGKILPMLVHILIDRPLKKDDTLPGTRISFWYQHQRGNNIQI